MVTLNNYGGYSASRYLKAEISYSSGTTLSWKITVMSGSVNYYSTGPTTLYINNKLVSETARLYASNYNNTSNKAFPVGPAGQYVSGTCNVGTYGSIPISFSTAIYNTTQETKTGSIDIYKISYDANGGTGTNPGTHYTSSGISTTIKSNSFTKTGYSFAGWTTNSNGTDDGHGWTGWSGSWGNWNSTYGISSYSLTLYARWTPNTVKITYYKNGGTIGSADYEDNGYGHIRRKSDSNIYFHTLNYASTDTDPYNASTFGLTKTGYKFNQWKVRSSGKILNQDAQQTITNYAHYDDENKTAANTSTVTCYLDAQWTANTYTITFDANGGSGSMSDITMIFDQVNSTAITNGFSRPGYKFLGWSITGMTSDVTHYRGGNNSVGTSFTGTSYAGPSTSKYFKNLRSSAGKVTFTAQWEINGVVKIYTSDGWKNAIPYVYDGGWKQAIPYIYDDGEWKICGP